MQEKDKVGQDVDQNENSAAKPQNTDSREMEGEGMSSSYSGMGDLKNEDGERMSGEDTDAADSTAP
ncbi:hypothetical protein [Deinococcus sp. Marseille-Q6407]|uniref:hypothetical protein n=1 Tax=Deinococcus sp. Marseille-Q6407 TaxID=2969223 RepID=UPI0021C17D91|nr:hypothetical protein [Deinococcus sp. Marseille-Q6407]